MAFFKAIASTDHKLNYQKIRYRQPHTYLTHGYCNPCFISTMADSSTTQIRAQITQIGLKTVQITKPFRI